MADQSNIQSAASKSIRPFKSSEEYLYAMKEDLAEWLNTLYELDITADTFIDGLETGCALCRHANNVNRAALEFQTEHPEAAQSMKMPCKDVVFLSRNVVAGSFLARDNVSNFIAWCRQELWIKDVLMFETNDLVERCNEKNLVLCLLEVARRGAKFGMLAPMLIQLEEEIEEEIRDQENLRDTAEAGDQSPPSRCFSQKEIRESVEEEPDPIPFICQQKRVLCDMRNLDELVREILGRCSCPAQFPMTKVSEGKYKVGDSSSLIFIRVLRTHVMVRVGGGWDTLEHYLDKHDPCRCNAFAHRYHQAKASGQGGHSKSSSAHSSRSTSPGPHWRNEGIAPYKPPDRRPLEPACAPGASSSTPSSSSSTTATTATRPGRSHHPSAPAQRDSSAGRALLPRPPRDRSEPRHFNPLRSKETVARRLSGDSDSSTASSKGGGGGGGGGRYSLGNASLRPGEEVVLLVNRKEGRHVIERPAAGGQSPALRPPLPRARSHSRERPAPAPTPGPALRSTPPQVSHGPERGRSLGVDGPRRLQGLRSHSQGKPLPRTRSIDASPGMAPRYRDPPPSDRREELRTKVAVAAPSSPRPGGGFARKQSSSCSNSPIKGSQSRSSSPRKKSFVSPRPPAPHSPSVGKARLLPSVATGGQRSPHSSPRNSQHHGPRSPRTSHSPRSVGRGHHRGLSLGLPEHREPEEEEEEEEKGLGFGFRMLPAVDPQKEQDLYRSFEAELLANTQQVRGGPSRAFRGVAAPHFLPSCVRQGPGTPPVQVAGDPNVTDSAYCSSNSSTSSVNVGAKVRALPDLRDCKRTAPPHHLPLEDPLSVPHNQGVPEGLHNGIQGDWFERGGGLKKLPAISSSAEERELLLTLPVIRNPEPDKLMNQVPSQQPPFHNRNINSVPSAAALTGQQNQFVWGSEAEGDVPLDEQQPNLPYDMEEDDDLPPPEAYTSPVALPPSEDCSFRDSSSENSSMCFSLSESRSEASLPPLANGDSDDDALLQSKTGSKKSDGEVPSVYKLKQGPRVRPRTDNRPDNSPSRIPTPVSYRDLQAHQGLSPRHTPPLSPQSVRSNGHPISRKTLHQAFTDLIHPQPYTQALGNNECAYPGQPGSLDTEAWM